MAARGGEGYFRRWGRKALWGRGMRLGIGSQGEGSRNSKAASCDPHGIPAQAFSGNPLLASHTDFLLLWSPSQLEPTPSL